MPPSTHSGPSSRISWLAATSVALAILWIWPGSSGLMHESDQASLVDGAWQLASGDGWQAALKSYNYDRLFFSYWMLAGVWKVLQAFGSFDIVAVGNILSSTVLAAAVLWLQWSARLSFRGQAAFFAVLLAPAFLLHAPYFAASFLSAGFLIAAFALLEATRGSRSVWRPLLAAALAFGAVGSRADAVLVMPLLAWIAGPTAVRPWRVLRSPAFLGLVAGSVGALLVGHVLQIGESLYTNTPIFVPKIFAAYTVFGLGGALVIMGWMLGCLTISAARGRGVWHRLMRIGGAVALLLPFAFYAAQLFSTRYWIPGLTALLLLIASRRGRFWCRRPAWPVAALGAALIPMLVGISLPFATKPRLTLHTPTLFPSADGLVPMGAYLSYTIPAPLHEAPDHNHAIWLAARATHFVPDETGTVPLMGSPMISILQLAVHLQKMKPQVHEPETSPARLYADSRSLSKWAGGLDAGGKMMDLLGNHLAGNASEAVSPTFLGIRIFLLEKKTPLEQPPATWRAWRALFHGDDFRAWPGNESWDGNGRWRHPLGAGKALAFIATEKFAIVATDKQGGQRVTASAPVEGVDGWQAVYLTAAEKDPAASLEIHPPSAGVGGFAAEALLPEYMSVRKFNH